MRPSPLHRRLLGVCRRGWPLPRPGRSWTAGGVWSVSRRQRWNPSRHGRRKRSVARPDQAERAQQGPRSRALPGPRRPRRPPLLQPRVQPRPAAWKLWRSTARARRGCSCRSRGQRRRMLMARPSSKRWWVLSGLGVVVPRARRATKLRALLWLGARPALAQPAGCVLVHWALR